MAARSGSARLLPDTSQVLENGRASGGRTRAVRDAATAKAHMSSWSMSRRWDIPSTHTPVTAALPGSTRPVCGRHPITDTGAYRADPDPHTCGSNNTPAGVGRSVSGSRVNRSSSVTVIAAARTTLCISGEITYASVCGG